MQSDGGVGSGLNDDEGVDAHDEIAHKSRIFLVFLIKFAHFSYFVSFY